MMENSSYLVTAKNLLVMIADELLRCRDGLDRGDVVYALDQAEKLGRHANHLRYNLDVAGLVHEHNTAYTRAQGELKKP